MRHAASEPVTSQGNPVFGVEVRGCRSPLRRTPSAQRSGSPTDRLDRPDRRYGRRHLDDAVTPL
jgi:hypothetical protein